MTSPDHRAGPGDLASAEPAQGAAGPEAEAGSGTAAPRGPGGSAPLVSEQSPEDTDAAWGEYPDRGDDDHLTRDRPPHWDDY